MAATSKPKPAPPKHKGHTKTHGELTSATTTAVVPVDEEADQSDRELEAFFGTGPGPAQHYHRQPMETHESASEEHTEKTQGRQ